MSNTADDQDSRDDPVTPFIQTTGQPAQRQDEGGTNQVFEIKPQKSFMKQRLATTYHGSSHKG